VPLSPNQQRALKYAEASMQDGRRQPGLPPFIQISGPGGVYQVYPGGRTVPVGPYPPPAVVESRAALPPAEKADRDTVHAPWVTPTPRELADLVSGR
jgi:hypothetical protein